MGDRGGGAGVGDRVHKFQSADACIAVVVNNLAAPQCGLPVPTHVGSKANATHLLSFVHAADASLTHVAALEQLMGGLCFEPKPVMPTCSV